MIKQFGSIDSQPRFKRRIECYWDETAKRYLPYVSPDRHRFTLYQAHLTTNHKHILRNNSFQILIVVIADVKVIPVKVAGRVMLIYIYQYLLPAKCVFKVMV